MKKDPFKKGEIIIYRTSKNNEKRLLEAREKFQELQTVISFFAKEIKKRIIKWTGGRNNKDC